MSPIAPPSTLDDLNLAAFIRGGVTASIATRDADRVPHLARGIGCHVEGGRVVVLFPKDQARSTLEDVAANRLVAVVFSQPSTHQTVQLKGSDATVVDVGPAERACVADFLSALTRQLESIGYPPPFTAALLDGGSGDLAGIAFTPDAAFSGTPGPRAGEPLGGAR